MCIRDRGEEKAKEIKKLSVKATPLRFVDMLFKDPIKIREEGVAVLVPNPVCFGIHKLLISARRKNKEKKRKDLEQAMFTLEVCDIKRVADYYSGLPKPWKRSILRTLEAAKMLLPLQEKYASGLFITLQATQ